MRCPPGASPGIHGYLPEFRALNIGVFRFSPLQSGLQGIYFSSLRFKLSSASSTSRIWALTDSCWQCGARRACPRPCAPASGRGLVPGEAARRLPQRPVNRDLQIAFCARPVPEGRSSNGCPVYGWGVAEPGKAIDAAQRPRRLSHSRRVEGGLIAFGDSLSPLDPVRYSLDFSDGVDDVLPVAARRPRQP